VQYVYEEMPYTRALQIFSASESEREYEIWLHRDAAEWRRIRGMLSAPAAPLVGFNEIAGIETPALP